MATFLEKRQCKICGAIISDNNKDGLGCECRYVFKKARKIIFFKEKERVYKYYNVRVDIFMNEFIGAFENTKFRSNFKKSFYPSIVGQYKEKGYLSKKQLDIVESMLVDKIGELIVNQMNDDVYKLQQQLIDRAEMTRDEEKEIIKLANSLRKEYRQKVG